jgi:predicted dehydrogenase
MVRIGVVGCGYWGPNLIRAFLENPEATVVAVADRDPGRLERIHSRHDNIRYLLQDHRAMFDLGLDAVVIATPPETHAQIAAECLRAGLDVFVEKPIAIKPRDALALVDLADAMDRVVMVGHITTYNPAVRALREMIESGELGEIRYIDAVRAGLGLFHPRLNVVWDLGPHDIAILMYLFDDIPTTASTRGISCVQEHVEDVAYMTLMYEAGFIAHLRMSWLDPYKTRRISVVGSQKMVVYDDLEPQEKLRVYDKRVSAIRETDTFGDSQFAYHYGSVLSPFVEFDEPLRVECQHFIECVQERRRPLTDARNGHRVVQVIDAAQRSLRLDGLEVAVAPPVDAIEDVLILATNGSRHDGNGGPIVDIDGNSDGDGIDERPAEPIDVGALAIATDAVDA